MSKKCNKEQLKIQPRPQGFSLGGEAKDYACGNLHKHAHAAILPINAFKLQISAQKSAL